MDEIGLKINIYVEEGLKIFENQDYFESDIQFDNFKEWHTRATIVRDASALESNLDALIVMLPGKLETDQRKKVANMIEKRMTKVKYFAGKPQIYVLMQKDLDKPLFNMFSNKSDIIKFQPYNLELQHEEILEYCLKFSYAARVQGIVAAKLLADERKKGHSKEVLYSTARFLSFPKILSATYFGKSMNFFTGDQPVIPASMNGNHLSESILLNQPTTLATNESIEQQHDTEDNEPKNEKERNREIINISPEWDNSLCRQHVAQKEVTNNMKIKFLVVKIDEDEPGFLDNMSSNVTKWALSFVGMYPELGMLHTALVIGPHKIEWNNSSYCMPRQMISRRPIFCLDLATIPSNKEYDKIKSVAADHIVEWNIYKKYSRMQANCQHFVVELIEKLGLNAEFDRCLNIMKTCLDDMERSTHKVQPSRAFCDLFGLAPTTVFKFSTHEELDTIVRNLQQKDSYLLNRPFVEVDILKAYDRPYWIKYKGSSNEYDEILRQHNNVAPDTDDVKKLKTTLEHCRPSGISCPFTEPSLTGSILTMPTPDWTKGRSTHQ